MDVGIRESKAHLPEFVKREASGGVIRVTDRGVPRAVLMPLPEADRVEQGLAEGWIVRKEHRAPAPARPVEPPTGASTGELLSEDRGE